MRQKHLKLFRIIISIFFLVSVSFLFIDFRELIPTSVHNKVLFLQFIPSLLKFINIISFAAIGFIVITILSVLFGRVYCSTICPLGILQDVFSWISKKLKIKKRYKLRQPNTFIRYFFFILTVGFIIFGSLFLVNLLDPYSNFGRIFSNIIRPAIIGLNNLMAGLLEKVNIFFLYPKDYEGFNVATIWLPVLIFGLVLIMSLFYGRLYCNTICPLGTFLGVLSKVSIFKIRFNEETCTKCARCAVACKSECIDFKNMKVDFDRCVGCFNCIKNCPEDSISFQYAYLHSDKKIPATDNTKRDFIAKSFLYLVGLAGISASKLKAAQNKNKTKYLRPEEKNYPLSPPGSISLEHFNNNCTACHLCVTACPTGVLQPAYLEYGFTNIMQPRMDYHTNYCNYECTKCSEVCPTGAILPLNELEKKTTQIGKVNLYLENCIVITENTACGSCSEHCPTQAVHMIPYNDITQPEIDPSICIGCGACEYACPVRPYRAIFVDGNKIHEKVELPQFDKLDEEVVEDFPF